MAEYRLSERDYSQMAEFIWMEFTRRKSTSKRTLLNEQWNEVDRQIRMEAKPLQSRSGRDELDAWMPALELPDQAASLEILTADARRLLFGDGPGDDWMECRPVLSPEYEARFKQAGNPIIGANGVPVGQFDQDSANMIVKSVLGHFHGLYDFRAHWDALLAEAIKYGTYVGRAANIDRSLTVEEYRGGRPGLLPMMIPVSIRNFFPDDVPQVVLHEGLEIAPSQMRRWWQRPEDIAKAAAKGGADAGWKAKGVAKVLEMAKEDKRTPRMLEVIEMEGDILVPRSTRDDVWLENYRVTVAKHGGPVVVRCRPNPVPFRSYFLGCYQSDDIDSPYGSSPLLKGRPLQEAMTEAANRSVQVAALQAEPPVSYSSDDADIAAAGGVRLSPGAEIELSRPDRFLVHSRIGDLNGLLAMLAGYSQRYDELTSTSQPRQSGEQKSHTTAQGNIIAESRSVLPTEDFAAGVALGPLTTWLYMEFHLAKQALGQPITAYIAGQEGHIEVRRQHWPDHCSFMVPSALAAVEQQRKQQRIAGVIAQLLQIDQAQAALGNLSAPTNWVEVKRELIRTMRIPNGEGFIARSQGDVGSTERETGVSSGSSGVEGAVPAQAPGV